MSSSVKHGGRILTVLLAGATVRAAAQTVTPGAREIWLLNFATLPVGDFPKRKDLSTNSSLEVVDRDGVHMLKAGTPGDFVISLPETLPDIFTLEFDVVPQESGNSDDLSFKGTRDKAKSSSSAEVFWSPASHRVVGGGDPDFQATTPNLGQTLPGQLSHVVASIEGTTIKLYTNNVRLYTVDDRRFARGLVLRVSLGGTDDQKGAVYLSRVRVAEGAATTTTIASATGPASAVGAVSAGPATQTGTITPIPAQSGSVATPPARTTEITKTVAGTTLSPPNRLTASGTPAMASLFWLAPTDWTPTGYSVVRSTVGTAESYVLTSAPLTTTRYEDRSGFTVGKTYTYIVTALSPDPRAFGTAQTVYQPPAPQNVSNVVAKVQGKDITLSWTGVSGASKYFIASSVETLAREVPATETLTTYTGVTPGRYTWAVGARYEPGPIETPAATWPNVTMELLAPRTITQTALSAAGGFGALGSRIMTLTALDAVGGFPGLAPRTLTLTSLIATGASAVVAPPTITLSGLSATGGFVGLAPRVLTLSGLTATSGFVSLSARTITLPGLSATGLTPVP